MVASHLLSRPAGGAHPGSPPARRAGNNRRFLEHPMIMHSQPPAKGRWFCWSAGGVRGGAKRRGRERGARGGALRRDLRSDPYCTLLHLTLSQTSAPTLVAPCCTLLHLTLSQTSAPILVALCCTLSHLTLSQTSAPILIAPCCTLSHLTLLQTSDPTRSAPRWGHALR